jgi:hypothetical protein
VAWSAAQPRRRRAVATVFGLLIALNVFQTYQYVRGYIHWDGMTRATYWAVFLRPSIPTEELEQIQAGWDREMPRVPRDSRNRLLGRSP